MRKQEKANLTIWLSLPLGIFVGMFLPSPFQPAGLVLAVVSSLIVVGRATCSNCQWNLFQRKSLKPQFFGEYYYVPKAQKVCSNCGYDDE